MIIILTIISTSTITIIVITNIVITIVTSSITIFIIFLIGISTSTLIQSHIIRNALYYMQTYITCFTALHTRAYHHLCMCWGQRDSNSQPTDLESDALPLRHTPLLCDVFGHTVLNVLLLLLVLLLVLLLLYYYSYYY